MMNKYLLVLVGIVLVLNLMSYSILERECGNYVDQFDGRVSAMGSAGVAEGKTFFSSLVNPANLSEVDSKIGFQTSVGIIRNSDDRSYPMYNFFDGYVDDATYVSNTNLFTDYYFGAFKL